MLDVDESRVRLPLQQRAEAVVGPGAVAGTTMVLVLRTLRLTIDDL
jgi:hypothetical protein